MRWCSLKSLVTLFVCKWWPSLRCLVFYWTRTSPKNIFLRVALLLHMYCRRAYVLKGNERYCYICVSVGNNVPFKLLSCCFQIILQLVRFLNLSYFSILDTFALLLSWMHMCLLCLYNTSVVHVVFVVLVF
jgi:hypothetical protein